MKFISKKLFVYLLVSLIDVANVHAMHSSEAESSTEEVILDYNLPPITNQPFDINQYNHDDWELERLFISPVKGRVGTLKDLQEAHTPIVNKTVDGKSLIQVVVEEPRVSFEKKRKVVKQLFESRSFNPNTRDAENRTPLQYAAQTGQIPVVQELAEHYRVDLQLVDDENRDVFDYLFLGYGTRLQKDRMMRVLIEKALAENTYIWGRDRTNHLKNLLHLCAAHNLHDSVKLLLIKKLIDPNKHDDEGNTPLLCALKAESLEVIALLTDINGFPVLADDVDASLLTCQEAYNYCHSQDNSFSHMPSYENLMAAITVLQNSKKIIEKRTKK